MRACVELLLSNTVVEPSAALSRGGEFMIAIPVWVRHLDNTADAETGNILEPVDHLHEHYRYPAIAKYGYLIAPKEPRYSIGIKQESGDKFLYPGEGLS